MYHIDKLVLGMVGTNCYLLWEDDHVWIIDPATRSQRIKEAIGQGIVDGIFLTHAHFDHIGGVDMLAEAYNCSVYMNELDKPLLKDSYLNFSMGEPVIVHHPVKTLLPGKHTIGAFQFELLDAPGHSEGCSMMIWHEHLICGDVLFEGSIGRTDLATSSNSKMMQTLQMIKTLDPSLIVHPGHGNETTLQKELMYNPFLQH